MYLKYYRPVISILLLLLLLLQMPFAMATDPSPQKDYSINHPFYESISQMEQLGVVKGTSLHTMEPDRKITKAEYIAFLIRLFNPEIEEQSSGEWYKVYEKAAVEMGLFDEHQLKAMENTITWSDIYPSSMEAAQIYPYHSSVFSNMPRLYASEPALSCAYTLIDAGLISREADVNRTPTRGEVLDYLYRLYRSKYKGAETDTVLNPATNLADNPQTEYQNSTTLSEMKNRPGMTGRWLIPDLGVNVATFRSWAQSVVDQADSSAMFTLGSMDVIADHDYQGFSSIIRCPVGTSAYFDFGNGLTEYVCTASFSGHNIKSTLTDDDHNDIQYSNPDGITCYTCNGNWQDIWIVFFQPA